VFQRTGVARCRQLIEPNIGVLCSNRARVRNFRAVDARLLSQWAHLSSRIRDSVAFSVSSRFGGRDNVSKAQFLPQMWSVGSVLGNLTHVSVNAHDP